MFASISFLFFLFVLAGWWFGAIAEDLSPDNPLVLFDQRVAVWFHQHATTTLTHVAKAITFFGSALGLTLLSVAVALVFIVCRAWFNLFLFAVTMTGECLLNVLLDGSRNVAAATKAPFGVR